VTGLGVAFSRTRETSNRRSKIFIHVDLFLVTLARGSCAIGILNLATKLAQIMVIYSQERYVELCVEWLSHDPW
jgi:hypothetical protein